MRQRSTRFIPAERRLVGASQNISLVGAHNPRSGASVEPFLIDKERDVFSLVISTVGTHRVSPDIASAGYFYPTSTPPSMPTDDIRRRARVYPHIGITIHFKHDNRITE